MVNNTDTRTVTVLNRAGLHARPSLAIAQTVRGSNSKVNIRTRDDRTIDAADILQLLSLGVPCGEELDIEAEGPDAQAVLDSLTAQFADRFGV